jgi:hypothetical protein
MLTTINARTSFQTVDYTIGIMVSISHTAATLTRLSLTNVLRAIVSAVEDIIAIGVLVGLATPTDARTNFIGILGTVIIAVAGPISIGVADIITDLFTIDNTIMIRIFISHTTATLSLINLASIHWTTIVTIPCAILVCIAEVITFFPTVCLAIIVDIIVGHTTPTGTFSHLIGIIGTTVFTVGRFVTIIIIKVITDLFAIHQAIVVSIHIGHATSTNAWS